MTTGLGPHLRLQRLGVLLHWCPACQVPHEIHLQASTHPARQRWDWNDRMDRPTFWPEFQVQLAGGGVCQYHITDQRIEFHPDSAHSLAGQVVPMPIYPARPGL